MTFSTGCEGRESYERKRARILESLTSLVEVDLLRAGAPMPVSPTAPVSGYRVLVSRGWTRPKAQLHTFGVKDPVPAITIPLAKGEIEPEIDLGDVLHSLYERARFDLRLRYDRPPEPPLTDDEAAWAAERTASLGDGPNASR